MKNGVGLIVREIDGEVHHGIEPLTDELLGKGDIVIKVAYSSINYKDMLAMQTRGGVIRHYPMIPGIDLSGEIIVSDDNDFPVGMNVIVTSYELGTVHPGGFSEYARVPKEWIVPLPEGLTLKQAMMYGTAGFTAAQSIKQLELLGMSVDNQPEILVTGSTGGVGSIATLILSKMGFENITATYRKDYQREFAANLGATKLLNVSNFEPTKRPLDRRIYDYVVDTVGGSLTADLLTKINEYGSIAISGNAGGVQLDTTVLPFILRGVNLLGINSVEVPMPERREIWNKLANEWNVADKLEYQQINLNEIPKVAQQLKEGKHLGRTIISM